VNVSRRTRACHVTGSRAQTTALTMDTAVWRECVTVTWAMVASTARMHTVHHVTQISNVLVMELATTYRANATANLHSLVSIVRSESALATARVTATAPPTPNVHAILGGWARNVLDACVVRVATDMGHVLQRASVCVTMAMAGRCVMSDYVRVQVLLAADTGRAKTPDCVNVLLPSLVEIVPHRHMTRMFE